MGRTGIDGSEKYVLLLENVNQVKARSQNILYNIYEIRTFCAMGTGIASLLRLLTQQKLSLYNRRKGLTCFSEVCLLLDSS